MRQKWQILHLLWIGSYPFGNMLWFNIRLTVAASGFTPPGRLLAQLGGFQTLKLDQNWGSWALVWVQFLNVVSVYAELCASGVWLWPLRLLITNGITSWRGWGKIPPRRRGGLSWATAEDASHWAHGEWAQKSRTQPKNRIYPGVGETWAATRRRLGLTSVFASRVRIASVRFWGASLRMSQDRSGLDSGGMRDQ